MQRFMAPIFVQLAEENKHLKEQLAKAQYRAAFLARNLQALREGKTL